MSRKKVLATSWHPGGANAIVPVIKKLRQENQVDVEVVGHGFSKAVFDSQGIKYHEVRDFGLIDVSPASMEGILKTTDSNFVLTGTSLQGDNEPEVIEQSTILAAKKLGIPSLAVLDFWANYTPRFSDEHFMKEDVMGKFRFLPDKVAVMDKYAESAMLEEGFDPGVIAITGNPHFDNLPAKAQAFNRLDRDRIISSTELSPNSTLGFYAGNVWREDEKVYGFWDLHNIDIAANVLNGLEAKTKAGLIVKLHPRMAQEDVNEIDDYIACNGEGKIKRVMGIDSQDLILATDFTMTPCSTVGVEAIYLNKPSMSVQPGLETTDHLGFVTKTKVIPAGYTDLACAELMGRAFEDSDFRNFMVKQASGFRTDGKATRRVTDLVYSMMN